MTAAVTYWLMALALGTTTIGIVAAFRSLRQRSEPECSVCGGRVKAGQVTCNECRTLDA